MPRQIEFTRHIFGTLTYSRDHSLDERWSTVSKHFNRFCQSYRRLHSCNLHYLRVVERHKDGYPHVHVLLQFPDARIRVENSRYFDQELYARWRLCWEHGHSDFQKPRSSSTGTLGYVMKYCLKNQTQKTVWKKIFALSSQTKTEPSQSNTSEQLQEPSFSQDNFLERLPTHYLGVKLLTWSRGFDFKPFIPAQSSDTFPHSSRSKREKSIIS